MRRAFANLFERQGEDPPAGDPPPGDTPGPSDDSPTAPPTSTPSVPTSRSTTSSSTSRSTSTRRTTTTTRTTPRTSSTPRPSSSPRPSVSSSFTSSVSHVSTPISAPSNSASYDPVLPSQPGSTLTAGNDSPDYGSPDATSTDVYDTPQDSATAQGNGPSSNKALQVVLPCLLIPLALIAIVLFILARRRKRNNALVDEFAYGSTFYGGGPNDTPLMTQNNRSGSVASSRYAHGHHSPAASHHSHHDHSLPSMQPALAAFVAPNLPTVNVIPPPASSHGHSHARHGSDDLDIKCAGPRVESAVSFNQIYDQYAQRSDSRSEAETDAASEVLAYDRASSATSHVVPTPMPDHPYATSPPSTTAQSSEWAGGYSTEPAVPPPHAYQHQTYVQPTYHQQTPSQHYAQQQIPAQPTYGSYAATDQVNPSMYAPAQRSSFFKRPQFMRNSTATDALPPAATTQIPSPSTPTHRSNGSGNVPPRLALPTFAFEFHDVGSAQATPLSTVYRFSDPFADPGRPQPPAETTPDTTTPRTRHPLSVQSTADGHVGSFSDDSSILGSSAPSVSAFPQPPTRVSAERRRARTRSVEQRLMMALDDSSKDYS